MVGASVSSWGARRPGKGKAHLCVWGLDSARDTWWMGTWFPAAWLSAHGVETSRLGFRGSGSWGEAGARPEAPSVGVVFKVSSCPWMWPLPGIAGGWGVWDGCGLVSVML